MYKYYVYGTKEYYDQELTKAIRNLRMTAKGFATMLDDIAAINIGLLDEYVETLHDAAVSYEAALDNYTKYVTDDNAEDNND